MLKLSFIIPFYNSEKYIVRCLNSIYSQSIPESVYEVICIDDCSWDDSSSLIAAYQNKHSNLFLYKHRINIIYSLNICLARKKAVTSFEAASNKNL